MIFELFLPVLSKYLKVDVVSYPHVLTAAPPSLPLSLTRAVQIPVLPTWNESTYKG